MLMMIYISSLITCNFYFKYIIYKNNFLRIDNNENLIIKNYHFFIFNTSIMYVECNNSKLNINILFNNNNLIEDGIKILFKYTMSQGNMQIT